MAYLHHIMKEWMDFDQSWENGFSAHNLQNEWMDFD